MPKNINSAYRIKEILKAISKKPDKMPVHEVWAEIFSIAEKDNQKKSFIISRCLADLHDEVELIRADMTKLGYSDDLYNSSLNKCNSIFAVQMVMGTWAQVKNQFTPEVPIALGFCSEILPNEEELIDKTDLDQLAKMTSELREFLKNSKLPQYTVSIIEKHLNKIDEAISKYKAVGARALEEVMQAAYGEVIANETVFNEAKGTEEVGRLSQIWQKTKSTLDGVVDANKKFGAIQGMAEKGIKLLEFIEKFNV